MIKSLTTGPVHNVMQPLFMFFDHLILQLDVVLNAIKLREMVVESSFE